VTTADDHPANPGGTYLRWLFANGTIRSQENVREGTSMVKIKIKKGNKGAEEQQGKSKRAETGGCSEIDGRPASRQVSRIR